jgi:indoleamine 2,3-dioxygenase
MKQSIINDLNYYEVDLIRGFLPKEDPLQELPILFKAWEDIATSLSVLLMTGKLRLALENLPVLDISHLRNEQQIQRAFLLLSVFGNAYVWGGDKTATIIPNTIAVPWCQLAEKLDRPPIVAHASMVLHNWRRLDRNRPIELDNIATLQLFLGGLDEQWFFLTNVAIEAKGAKALASIVEIQKSILTRNIQAVVQHLIVIAEVLTDIYTILLQIPKKCDPYIFYHRVRPWLAGWHEPGIIYEGVSEKPQKFVGGSAAQSSLIQSFDAGLGVKHNGDKEAFFLHSMRSYMPPPHRKFIEALESGPSLRQFVINLKLDYPVLCTLYNDCIQTLENFRKKHMQIAAWYIAGQAPNHQKGTGGTDFTHLLKEVRRDTAEHLISL